MAVKPSAFRAGLLLALAAAISHASPLPPGVKAEWDVTQAYRDVTPTRERVPNWFEHWATAGVKPAFTCEYAAPFSWDWTMYRGWYKGEREFGSAKVPWKFCLAEWNAQFIGPRAFQISDAEKANLRWEAKQFRAGNFWHRWDYPHQVGSTTFDERYPIRLACIPAFFSAMLRPS